LIRNELSGIRLIFEWLDTCNLYLESLKTTSIYKHIIINILLQSKTCILCISQSNCNFHLLQKEN